MDASAQSLEVSIEFEQEAEPRDCTECDRCECDSSFELRYLPQPAPVDDVSGNDTCDQTGGSGDNDIELLLQELTPFYLLKPYGLSKSA